MNYNYKKGLPAILICLLMWGFQPLYWMLCRQFDTFFLMASRIIWAAVFCMLIIVLQGKLPLLTAVFKDRKTLLTEAAASLFLFADWIIYLWAVQNSRVLEVSLGYYIMPLMMFSFGAFIYKERLSWTHFLVLAAVVTGICFSVKGFGKVSFVTVSLALSFAVYAAIKKGLSVDSVVSTTSEILLMVPVAVAFIIIFRRAELVDTVTNLSSLACLAGGGLVTAAPMVCYSIGVSCLPLTMAAVLEYLSPTLSIICGVIMGETLTRDKAISFVLMWIGVGLFIYDTMKNRNTSN